MARKKIDQNPPIKITYEQEDSKFYNMPTSPAMDLWTKTLGTDGDIAKLQANEKTTRAGVQYDLREMGTQRRIVATKGDTETTLIIPNIDKLKGSNKGVKKIFLYTLIAINEQAFSVDTDTGAGKLRQTYVTFPLKALVQAGLYSNIVSARTGFNRAMKVLNEQFSISGTTALNKGKKKIVTQGIVSSPFDNTYGIKNGQCVIGLSANFNFELLALYYTIIPKYCFSLKINAFDLLYTIFYLARQNVDKIKEQGFFNINLDTVRARLGLPTPAEVKNRKYQQYIKTPIEQAIVEIEDTCKDSNFTITPIYDENGSIADYLSRGYLKIGMAGDYAEAFIARATDKAEQIEKAQQKKEKAEEIARARALQKLAKSQKATETDDKDQ